jgi:8-oxo-dGTP diphosphatase
MLYLVRHADAGDRYGWQGDDFQRPLDDFGQMQAEAIGVALASRPVQRILSSAAVRCVDTVVPLGRMLGLPVEIADELAEGTFVGDAFDLLRSLASSEGDSVLCSHGDVIPGLLWVLAQYGLDIPDLGRCKKGSIWELEVSDGRIVGASYRHPRTFGAA